MTEMTKPRETFRHAFYTVLNAALGSETEVVEYQAFDGAPQHSIVLHMVSGSNKRPGFGRRTSATQSGMMERYRVQISIHNPYGRKEAEQEADKVEQAIIAALHSPFRTIYGMHDIRRLVETDQGPTEALERVAHSILDYEGWIISDKTDPP
jgi:hypothetical protein